MLYYEYGIRESRTGRPTEGEASPANDSRSDETGRRSATESACTRDSALRGTLNQGLEANTLRNRELLERELKTTF